MNNSLTDELPNSPTPRKWGHPTVLCCHALLPGRKHGLYSKRELNRLAQKTVEKILAEEERIVAEQISSTGSSQVETVEMPAADLTATRGCSFSLDCAYY